MKTFQIDCLFSQHHTFFIQAEDVDKAEEIAREIVEDAPQAIVSEEIDSNGYHDFTAQETVDPEQISAAEATMLNYKLETNYAN